jgi:Cyclic nucleotide-binding domain
LVKGFFIKLVVQANHIRKVKSFHILEYLLAHSRLEIYQADQIIHEGQSSRFFWVLLSGAWRNTRKVQGSDKALEVERDKPGTWFGGIEFVDTVAPMKAVALQESQFLVIPTETMHEMIRRDFPVTQHLMSGVKAGMTWFLEHLAKK